MAVMAKWLDKQWEVSPKKIIALDGLSTSFKLKSDTNEDAAGEPATNVRGLELQTLSFNTLLSDSVGADVINEINSWRSLIGKSAPFYLAGRQFGPDKLMPESVSVSDTVVDDFGRLRKAKLAFSFKEDAGESSKSKTKSSSKKKKLTPGIASASTYSELGVSSASGVGASSSDKRAKKASLQ